MSVCDCVLVSLSFLAGLLGVFLSCIQECLSGRGCDVPLLFGPALLTLLPSRVLGLMLQASSRFYPGVFRGEGSAQLGWVC